MEIWRRQLLWTFYILKGDSNFYHTLPRCKTVFDLVCWVMWNNFWGICLVLPIMLNFTPAGKAPNVEVVLTPKYVNSIYTFRYQWNYHQVGSHRYRAPSVSQSSGKTPQVTLEQYRFEMRGSTYKQMVFNKNILKNLGDFLTTTKQLYQLY